MNRVSKTRRSLLATTAASAGLVLITGAPGLIRSASAEGVAATPSMRGGANNYRPGADIVEKIGNGGFLMTGTVKQAGDGAPLANRRIQVWAHTTEGHERDDRSHGATLTNSEGVFQLEMPQIVPAFGQAHGHLAYDADYNDGDFETVFMRPIMSSPNDKTLNVAFVLQPA